MNESPSMLVHPDRVLLYRLATALQPDGAHQQADRVTVASRLLRAVQQHRFIRERGSEEIGAIAEAAAHFLKGRIDQSSHADDASLEGAIKEAWDLYDHAMRHFSKDIGGDATFTGWGTPRPA